jgi:hypothetical protein
MKFRTIFWIFNIVLLISFLAVGFMPIPLLGWEVTQQFWGDYWYLFLAFLLGIVVINVLFLAQFQTGSAPGRVKIGTNSGHTSMKKCRRVGSMNGTPGTSSILL